MANDIAATNNVHGMFASRIRADEGVHECGCETERCTVKNDDRSRAESESLRARLSGLIEAILRISEDLDLDVLLQQIAESARSLTAARYGAIATLDDSGDLQDMVISGLSPEEQHAMTSKDPQGEAMFGYLSGLCEPLGICDFGTHVASTGMPGLASVVGPFMAARVRARNSHLGNIFIAREPGGQEFTREDEETLEMFANQAAMAVTNARRYGEEQRAKADLEALVNTSPVGVLVFDPKTCIPVIANREARRIMDLPHDRSGDLATRLRQISFRRMDGSAVANEDLPVVRAARAGESVQAEELVVCRASGQEVTTLVNATPIRADDGEIASIVATVQDITPLEELERLRAEFLGMVSHELRAPLAAIKGSAATARGASSPLDPAETRQFFRIIEEQADQMRDLINNLLDLTRIEAGTLSIGPDTTDVAAVIEQAKNAFLSSGHHSSVEVEMMPELPRVWADGQRLVQVLLNLLSNAARCSRKWSTITVAASLQDLYVAVSVTDDGTGVTAEQMPRLFSKFSQVDSGAGGQRENGYGLGLAICKGIVETHGGRIWAESDGLGHGTRFTFTIPTVDAIAARSAADPETAPGVSPQVSAGVERVLVVDDDPQMLRYVRNTLLEGGYTPILTGDPSEVGDLLATEMPHLILLNLVLPGTDGFELMKQISSAADVPVIFLSGRDGDRYVVKAFEMGAADYVAKPFSPTELLARISAALRRRAMSQHAEPYRLGDLVVDYVGHKVTVAGRATKLTPTEYKLLLELCTNAGRVLTYDQILERVWGAAVTGDAQRVRTCVKDLRQKLGDDARNPAYIFTEPGAGYRAGTPRA